MNDQTRRIVRAIFGLKSPPPAGSPHYRSGWDDGLEAAIDAVKSVAPAEVARREATAHRSRSDASAPKLVDVLRNAADRIDAEDVPQTAGDTADFVDGARWATGQLRAIAGEADAAPGDLGWLPDWLVGLAREHAVSLLSDDERAMLRYALGCAREDMDDRADEFTDAEGAALESLRRLAGEEV